MKYVRHKNKAGHFPAARRTRRRTEKQTETQTRMKTNTASGSKKAVRAELRCY